LDISQDIIISGVAFECGDEFVEEGFAEIFLTERRSEGSFFLDRLNIFVTRPSGTIEYLSLRVDLEAMLECESVKPELENMRRRHTSAEF
jgi:hypothetical protein